MILKPTQNHGRNLRRWAAAAALFGAMNTVGGLYAADSTAAAPSNYDPAFVQQMLKRLDSQEAEIKRLNEALKKQGADIEANSGGDSTKKDTFPSVSFHGFGDINYVVSDFRSKQNAFALGELDLFLDSRLSQDIKFITEVVVAANEFDNFDLDVERMFLQWHPDDWLNLSLGRYHNSIGYYNTTFHHGTWFQTATGRPSFLAFEDSGGLIAAHNVGLSATGDLPSGKLNLSYALEIGNGRPINPPGSPVGAVQNSFDANLYKSVNLAFRVKPEFLPGWELGAGLYHDTLSPKGTSEAYPDGVGRTDEFMAHGFAVYKNANWQFLSEGEVWRHKTRGERVHISQAAFGQLERRFGKFTPYARFTYQNASNNDNLWQFAGLAGLRYGPSVGVRYDFSQLVALKVQYDHFLQPGTGDLQQLTLQAAFTF
jgi:hypothetical protein